MSRKEIQSRMPQNEIDQNNKRYNTVMIVLIVLFVGLVYATISGTFTMSLDARIYHIWGPFYTDSNILFRFMVSFFFIAFLLAWFKSKYIRR